MLENLRTGPAPSISADSYKSLDTPLMEAR